MGDIFLSYHPVVLFCYLFFAISTSMLTTNPVYLVLSLVCGSMYFIYLTGFKSYAKRLKIMIPMFVVISAINPLFNHRGFTALFFLFGNPVTLESFVHGLCLGAMFLSVYIWFACFMKVITNDKFLYLFGGVFPRIALMLSMVLRLIPKMKRRATEVSHANYMSGKALNKAGKIASSVRVSTTLLEWSMQDALETADSMRARGYGQGRRTCYNTYNFRLSDALFLLLIVAVGIINILVILTSNSALYFYPFIDIPSVSALWYVFYIGILALPMIIEVGGRIKWKLSR